jgi:hypothetical protein
MKRTDYADRLYNGCYKKVNVRESKELIEKRFGKKAQQRVLGRANFIFRKSLLLSFLVIKLGIEAAGFTDENPPHPMVFVVRVVFVCHYSFYFLTQ